MLPPAPADDGDRAVPPVPLPAHQQLLAAVLLVSGDIRAGGVGQGLQARRALPLAASMGRSSMPDVVHTCTSWRASASATLRCALRHSSLHKTRECDPRADLVSFFTTPICIRVSQWAWARTCVINLLRSWKDWCLTVQGKQAEQKRSALQLCTPALIRACLARHPTLTLPHHPSLTRRSNPTPGTGGSCGSRLCRRATKSGSNSGRPPCGPSTGQRCRCARAGRAVSQGAR